MVDPDRSQMTISYGTTIAATFMSDNLGKNTDTHSEYLIPILFL